MLYHALNRGVDKRTIFLDDMDRARFIHDMYEFNDNAAAGNAYRSFRAGDIIEAEMMDLRNPSFQRQRDPIVDIHGWCLMGNHYHLLLSERADGGISLFLRKLNVGYANYFNEKYHRSGTLFQGRTKKIHIETEAHFLHILNYIHFNPLDFLKDSENWRMRRIKSQREALAHLDTYRWSSYLDYCGKKNFPSILSKDLFADIFKDYKREVRESLQAIDVSNIKPYLLE